MWKENLKDWPQWFRSCAICLAMRPPIDLFCPRCHERLLLFQNRGGQLSQADYPFSVYSLHTWTPESDSLIRPFAYALKSGPRTKVFDTLAKNMSFEMHEMGQLNPAVGQIQFVVPPSRSGGPDHAFLWAQALAECWQQDEPLTLLWSEATRNARSCASQKGRGRLERAEIEFQPIEYRESPSETVFIFADDVITTGATALAAYRALGFPKHFQVWTLVCRPELASFSGI